MADPNQLSKRERQIMQIVYARGQGKGGGKGVSANEVVAGMADAPTRTTVRTLLRILEEKGHLTHTVGGEGGREFVYKPTKGRMQVGRSALKSVVHAFFSNSLPQALAAYLADPKTMLTVEEAAELKGLIDQAKKRGE
jgi:predicted transcriptional regulator